MGNTAFSKMFTSAFDLIVTSCKVSDCYDFKVDANLPHPRYVECSAMWDTGAVRSVVSHKLAKQLGLQSMGFATMMHADGESRVNALCVNLLLPNNIEVQMLPVIESNLLDTDLLIGMDVIGLCDIALTHPEGKMLFTFDTNRSRCIDFVDSSLIAEEPPVSYITK